MACATSVECENVSANLQSSFSVDEIEIGESASFECYADKLAFKCVWQHPDVNMHIINQFMEQINIYDSNEFGDQTPSNIMDLLSSSFPSGFGEDLPPVEEPPAQAKPEETVTFFASTPLHKGSDCCSSAKRRNDKKAFQDFNDASPILSQPRQKAVLTKKRLHMSQETEELEGSRKLLKT